MNEYIVSARRYRPILFEEVVNQEAVVKTLSNAIDNKRIAHAYLFAGPRGIGKTTVARIVARSIRCENGPSSHPCGKCPACIESLKGSSLDIIEIDGASNRGIDEIRNLRENVRYPPQTGKFKIYIIDEVHMLTNEAFNALLKTLEEPPPHIVFIFATTEPHKVPPTIHSRCQRFDFRLLTTQEISNKLAEVSEKENIKISSEAIRLIAKKAEGSMRDALSLLDQIIAFCGDNIELDDVQKSLGVIDYNLFVELFNLIINHKPGDVIKLLDKVLQSGHSLGEFAKELVEFFRTLLILKLEENPTEILLLENEKQLKLLELIKDFSLEDLERLVSHSSRILEGLRYSTDVRLTIEQGLIRMALLERVQDIAYLIKKLESGDYFSEEQKQKVDAKHIPARKSQLTSDNKLETFLSKKAWAEGKRILSSILDEIEIETNENNEIVFNIQKDSLILQTIRENLENLKNWCSEFLKKDFSIKINEISGQETKIDSNIEKQKPADLNEKTDQNILEKKIKNEIELKKIDSEKDEEINKSLLIETIELFGGEIEEENR